MPTQFQQAVTRLAASAPGRGTDAHLVADFLQSGDQDAFAELVRRHGPTVLGVCQRFLGATPDAEDAFQATFLVFVRRARGTEWRESLGPWLYGVALKVARKARAARVRRRMNEKPVTAMTDDATTTIPEPDDTAAIIDEELAAIPTVYRLPLVLCEIQGRSRRDAARELGIAEGTLSSRLARGRKMLRERLVRRGVGPVVSGLAVAVPGGLASATVRNAFNVLTHAVGAVPAGVMALTEGVVKTMIVQWKLAAVLIAACIGLSGFSAWHSTNGPAAVAASDPPGAKPAIPPPEKTPPVAAPKPVEPVATIFGDVLVSREEFADYLIRKYGKKDLELFVNKQIISHAFTKKGWTLKTEDVTAALEEDCKALGVNRDDFTRKVLPRYKKTLEEWTEDVVTPRLMLARLCEVKPTAVTEAELRQAFEAKYGEKIQCIVITWTKDEGAEARKVYELVRDDKEEFNRYASRSSNANLAAIGGLVAPIPRTLPPDATELHTTAAKLNAGEVSPLVATTDGFIVVKCLAVIPADKTRAFDKEKPMLLEEVVRAKIEREMPKLFKELKQQANPKYHLTFPDPVAPPTTGTKEK